MSSPNLLALLRPKVCWFQFWNYVRSVLKLALGDDKAALLIDRILQGGDVSEAESEMDGSAFRCGTPAQ